MTICGKCMKKMKAAGLADLGVRVDLDGLRYYGDRLTCPECGMTVLSRFGEPTPAEKQQEVAG